jgi:predicted RNA-binding Zn-ribbon protein involved in translation (DUF1610 family)
LSRDARNYLPFRCTSNKTNIASLYQIVEQELSECGEEKFVDIKMVIRSRSLRKDKQYNAQKIKERKDN